MIRYEFHIGRLDLGSRPLFLRGGSVKWVLVRMPTKLAARKNPSKRATSRGTRRGVRGPWQRVAKGWCGPARACDGPGGSTREP